MPCQIFVDMSLIAYKRFLHKLWSYVRQKLKLTDKQPERRTCGQMKDYRSQH